MKRIHLLRFEGAAEALAPLLAAAAREGLRVGWLDLTPEEPPAPVPAGLDAAAAAGAFRAVAVGAGRAVALKRPGGPPVVGDLLREHFLGCTLVVVRAAPETAGLADQATLEVAGEGYRVRAPGEAARAFAADALAARLRRPQPW